MTTFRKRISAITMWSTLFIIALLSSTALFAQEVLKDGGILTNTGTIFTGTSDNGTTLALQTNSTALLECPTLPGEIVEKRKIQNVVAVKLAEEHIHYLPNDFVCTLKVNINYGDGPLQNMDRDFIITYNKAEGTKYQARQYFTFEDEPNVRVTIKGFVNTVPTFSGFDVRDLLVVEHEMRVTRYYSLSSTSATRQPETFSFNNILGAARIFWSWPSGCGNNYTQLEYTWVEEELEPYYHRNNQLDHDLLFSNNATRIDLPVTQNSYTIPLLFNGGSGHMYYRIRAVNLTNEGRVDGEWSQVRSYSADGHDNVRNWQVRTSFAEEGKSKSVIEYFDGSLRSRQTITRAGGVTIAAETMYDEQGRPAVQVLPAPLLYGPFEFRPNLNMFDGQIETADPADFFDLDVTPKPMIASAAQGAAGYYSINNPDITGLNRFVPDAEGYPYTLTRFTPDGTGRIQSQSGVGSTFKTGGGRETKYYYGSPAQEELDGLFGTDVGNKTHYFKNMVKDADGQMSVSYVDMHGRTIATALAGAAPANLMSLDYTNNNLYPNQAGTPMVRNLLDANTNIIKGNSIESINSILVPIRGTYQFEYILSPEALQTAACEGAAQPVICHDCMYDLEISVADESGEHEPVVKRFTNVSLINGTACDGVPALKDIVTNAVSNTVSFPLLLEEGSYSIRKTLTVSEASITRYRELWIQQNLCKTQQEIIDSVYQALLQITDCDNNTVGVNSCQECEASLGDYSTQYKPSYLSSIGHIGAVSPALENEIRAAYDRAAENCRLLCDNLSQVAISKRELMLSDVSPGGQYAKLPVATSGSTMFNQYDIFSTSRPGNPGAAFRTPRLNPTATDFYRNDAGEVDAIIHPAGNNALLNVIGAEDFAGMFPRSWAKSLLPYHPEYPRLVYAESAAMAASYNWINTFSNTPTYAEAATAGFFNVPNNDPFYTTPGSSLKTAMQGWVGSNFAGGLSIWQIARGTVMCKSITDPAAKESCYSTSVNVSDPFNGITSTAERDEIWVVFRNLYTSQREQQVNSHIASVHPLSNEQTLITQGYTIRFATNGVMAQQNNWGGWVPSQPGATPSVPITNVPQDSLNNYTNATGCTGYISNWKNTLLECPAVANHPQVDSILAQITRGMEAVCRKGSDANNPNGSSTVAPSTPNDGSPRSFEAVIHTIFSQYGIALTDVCNAYMIDFPKPYGGIVTSPVPPANADDCMCEKYQAIAAAASAAGFNPTYMPTLNQYLQITYGDTITQAVYNRITSCMMRAEAPEELAPLPYFFQCDDANSTCLTCSALSSLILQFQDTLSAPYNNAPVLVGLYSDSSIRYHESLARFLNFRTGNTYTWSEYLSAAAAVGCDLNSLLANVGGDGPVPATLDISSRAGSTPSQYVASQLITFLPGFESGANDAFIAYISDGSGDLQVVICPRPPSNQDTTGLIMNPPKCLKTYTMAEALATQIYQQRLEYLLTDFEQRYRAKCLDATESFTVSYSNPEYHYTLYYYDMAGSLVRTVPPKGVRPDFSQTFTNQVKAARASNTDLQRQHELETEYRYNTLGQVVGQFSPDGNYSEFWYDNLGRLVVSRNEQQKDDSKFSYTRYDALGRIIEVGQKPTTSPMSQTVSQDPTALNSWIMTSGSTREKLTITRYDKPYGTDAEDSENILLGLIKQQNLRNRVSFSYVKDLASDAFHHNATFYTYDIHGNVDTLLQDYHSVTGMGNDRFKMIAYDYDLISGKVNGVDYQPDLYNGTTWSNHPDKFFHRYTYDNDNRLIKVLTSRDKIYWEREAEYQYYLHGPLARTVLGEQNVQGVDYAYTIQGWLKGVNSTSVGDGVYDMGADGGVSNTSVARDVFGFGLHYFDNNSTQQDYKPIDVTTNAFARPGAAANMASLYNGNIAAMSVNLPALQKGGVGTNAAPLFYKYRYDQLNRLKSMETFKGLSSNVWTPVSISDYNESVVYDPNGNIYNYNRKGANEAGKPVEMDQLTYHYDNNTNRLNYVHDQVSASAYTEDVDAQSADNYTYDKIGNLKTDNAEGITNIVWNVYGKISSIVKAGNTISYTYDAAGNRISKTTSSNNQTTIYVRDASGNVMSAYQHASGTTAQNETHVYGSSRMGMVNPLSVPVVDVTLNGSTKTARFRTFVRGEKLFELSNHLGNVLAVVSDRRVQVDPGGNMPFYYVADVKSATDYYPFGMGMVGRTYSSGGYRYGFNGKENDNEVKGEGNQQDYGMRIYDPRLARFLSTDPLSRNFPYYSPYHFAGCNPIKFIDLDGGEPKDYVENWKPRAIGFARNNQIAGVGHNNSYTTVEDATLGWISVELIYDKVSDQTWFVHKGNNGKTYYYHSDDDQHGIMGIQVPKNGMAIVSNGGFREFETANAADNRIRRELATGLAVFWSVTLGGTIATNGAFIYEVALAWLEDALGIPIFNRPDDIVRNSEKREAERLLAKSQKCFVAGTLILAKDSVKKIEEIIVGDFVWAFDETTNKTELKKVEATFKNVVNNLVSISFANETILSTLEHPFWIGKAWVKAKDIQVGDSLTGVTGGKFVVSGRKMIDTTAFVYNFSVEDYHTYFVSTSGILVHNTCFEPVVLKNGRKGGSQLNKAIKEVDQGGGVPRLNEDGTQKVFEGRGKHAKWAGALEYQVTVPNEADTYRILKKQTGVDATGAPTYKYGYTYDHYENVHEFKPIKTANE